MVSQSRLSADVLYGAKAIAEELGIPRATVYHFAATGVIPTFKLGNVIVARRSELEAALTARAGIA